MRYKGKVYRPPSEAYSLIIQVTYGCSHNRCAFCDMYDDKRFALRPMEEIREDFCLARQVYRRVERVFLADGDALMRKTDELLEILAHGRGNLAPVLFGVRARGPLLGIPLDAGDERADRVERAVGSGLDRTSAGRHRQGLYAPAQAAR